MPTKGTKPRAIRFPPQLVEEVTAAMFRRWGTRGFKPVTFSDWIKSAVKEKLDHMERSRNSRKKAPPARSQDDLEATPEEKRARDYEEFREWVEGPPTSAEGPEDEEPTELEPRGAIEGAEKMTAKELLYIQFANVWERMARDGTVDEVGGAEFNRCWEEYSAQLPTDRLEDFIRESANRPSPNV